MEEWQNEILAVFKDLTTLFDEFGREITELVEEVSQQACTPLPMQSSVLPLPQKSSE